MTILTNINDNQAFTGFDLFPAEIIFHIFDYLSSNDIIYAFLNFNQRFNSLLLQHQSYLSYLELPNRHIDFWTNILSIIGIRIQYLFITSNDILFSLNLFPNLKSIKISSSFPFNYQHLSLLIENEQFKKLESFQIESNFILLKSPYTHRENIEKILFEKVFNNDNSLKIFEYSPTTSRVSLERIPNLTFNLNIQTLSLKKISLQLAFSIIEYVPNLKHLIIIVDTIAIDTNNISIFQLSNIQLKKLYLTYDSNIEQSYTYNEFLTVTDIIRQFSSSLICLSIDVSNAESNEKDEIPFNGIKFQQQFLQSMIELKEFHLYVKLCENWYDIDRILSTFSNEFWFNHNWSIGTHGNYLYTLPFHFNKLKNFIDFNDIKSNNLEILDNNYRLWYNVKSIELSKSNEFNSNFIKQLKIKMPKLMTIKFNSEYLYNTWQATENEILYSVTTVHLSNQSLDNIKSWLIHILPNVKYLILSNSQVSLIKNELAPILNKKIQQLDIITSSTFEQLIKMSNIFFSNVQYIQLTICFKLNNCECYANDIKKILKYFKNLNKLSINMYGRGNWPEVEMTKLLQYLKINEIQKDYQIKYYHEYVLFLKKSFYT